MFKKWVPFIEQIDKEIMKKKFKDKPGDLREKFGNALYSIHNAFGPRRFQHPLTNSELVKSPSRSPRKAIGKKHDTRNREDPSLPVKPRSFDIGGSASPASERKRQPSSATRLRTNQAKVNKLTQDNDDGRDL